MEVFKYYNYYLIATHKAKSFNTLCFKNLKLIIKNFIYKRIIQVQI